MDKSDVLKISKNMYGAIPALLDGMSVGFAVMRVLIDEDGEPFDFVYEYANKMFASLENMSLEDLRQYSWGQLFPDQEIQVLGAYANVALNGGNRIIEEAEESGERKLHINCYQPAYGYCALIVEEVLAERNSVPVQEVQVPGNTEEKMAQILAEEELQKMQQLAQQASFMESAGEEAAPPEPIEPLSAAPQQEAVPEATPVAPLEPVTPLEPLSAAPLQETVPEATPAVPLEPVAPIEPLSAAPLQEAVPEATPAAPIEPLSAVPLQEAVPEATPAAPLEPLSAVPLQETVPEATPAAPLEPLSAVPLQEAVPVAAPLEPLSAVPLQEAVPEATPVAPIEPLSAVPLQETVPEATPVAPIEQLAAVLQQETVPEAASLAAMPQQEEELITGGVTVSHIVEENKPAGYATIADLMASANQNPNQYQNEAADEYTGEAMPIGSIVNSYGGDSEGTWSEPGNSSDTVEFTEVETFEEEVPENIESFVSEEDTAAFVAVGEETEFEAPMTGEAEKPAEPVKEEPEAPVPELQADENSLMAKIKKVVESLNQFNEDMALEILAGLSNDGSLDAAVVSDVKKVKAMVECSMFEEAKELAQSLVAS